MIRFTVVAAALFAGCGLDSNGKSACETQADCLDGYTCNPQTLTCESEAPDDGGPDCVAATCDGVECGPINDGCGHTLTCAMCSGTDVCGGVTPNVCGARPDHCFDGITNMGETDRDCGGTCGACDNGKACAAQSDCATGTCQDNTCAIGRWTTVASMPTSRLYTGAASVGGKIYVIGGFTSNNGVTGVNEVYDPVANSWGTAAPMLTPRYAFGTAVSPDGVIYTIGDTYNSNTSPSSDGNSIVVEAFTPTTNTWSSLPSLPDGRYHAGAVWSNGRIYVMGGLTVNPIALLGSVVSLAPGESSWRAEPSMTAPRESMGAAVDATGRIYVVAGFGTNSTKLATAEYFDPGTTSWHTLPDLSLARMELGAVIVGQQLFAMGGNANTAVYSQTVDVLELTTNTWSLGAKEPMGRFGMGITVGPNNKVYLFGGADAGPDNTSKVVDVFTP